MEQTRGDERQSWDGVSNVEAKTVEARTLYCPAHTSLQLFILIPLPFVVFFVLFIQQFPLLKGVLTMLDKAYNM